jgi:heavy metal sensor kinase
LLAAVLAGRWMAGIALAPLSRLAADVRSVDVTNLEQRLPVGGSGDELDEVAHAFNRTLTRLEHAVGEMRQFSTALAHELRTPLAALRGEIELAMLDSRAADDVRQRFASQIEEIDKLKRLIDRLLTLARAEAGQIPLAHERVDLRDLTRSVAEQIEPVAKFKAIEFECECESAIVRGDAAWLERLLLNLLDNAIKFTPPQGSVTLRLSQDDGYARIQVRDTGVGISPAVVPHIFDRFFRADPARSPATDGVGLGLSLAKWIVDRHNGRIEVDSQPGKGSVFTVRLPLY